MGSADAFSITRSAIDPRADGARRTVHLSANAVTIERSLDGVRMRLGVPTAAYRELVISVQAPGGRATLRLRHDDNELDVVIGSGEAEEVARSARAWSAVTGKAVRVEHGAVELRAPHPRMARTRALERFARRRKPGVASRLAVCFAGEREIIARD